MIELNDPIPQPSPAEDPYDESIDYTTRRILLQNDSIITLLADVAANMKRMSDYTARQTSRISPTLIDLGPLSGKPNAGTAGGAIWQTTQRFRVTNVLLGGAAGDNLRLSLGVVKYNFFNNTGAMIFIPFEIEVDRGIDINLADITSPAALGWTFMLQGYAE